jgi:hypothetical protein
MDLKFLDNENVALGVAMFVALYGLSLGRAPLPPMIRNLFNNNLFRVAFLSLLLIANFKKTPHVAVAVALIFVVTLNYLSEEEMKEEFARLEAFRNERRVKRSFNRRH